MTVDRLLNRRGVIVLVHREGELVPCPCRTPEGYRDPEWHKANPTYPECNDAGFLVDPIEYNIKALMIPASMGGRRGMQNITQMFGEIRSDDYVGVFPPTLNGVALSFDNWSPAGDEYVAWSGMRFQIVAWTRVPDPNNTNNMHHWEVALRRIDTSDPGSGSF